MSSVGSISAVGNAASTSGVGAQKGTGGEAAVQSAPVAGNAPDGGAVSSRGMYSNMSSNDFVTLSQKMSESSESNGGLIDPKKMIGIVLALELLQKVVEATGELIDSMISGK